MLFKTDDEMIAERYFRSSQDIGALFGFSAGFSCLQFNDPRPFAMIVTALFFLWGYISGRSYRRISKAYLKQYSGWFGGIRFAVTKLPLVVLCLAFLTFIMMGALTAKRISEWGQFLPPLPL
jgi:phosphotransferase system  glucose/maltose/N-acetylglucosamine-specific IIC component